MIYFVFSRYEQKNGEPFMKLYLLVTLLLFPFASTQILAYCDIEATEKDFKTTRSKSLVSYILRVKNYIEKWHLVNDPRYNRPFRYYSSFNCDRGGIVLTKCPVSYGTSEVTLKIEFLGFGNNDESAGARGDVVLLLDTDKDTEDVINFTTLKGNKLSIDYKKDGYFDDLGFPRFKSHIQYDIELRENNHGEDKVTKLDFVRHYPGFPEHSSYNSCIR